MTPAALVRLFARHRNAANLVMLLMILAGVAAIARLNTQFFPDFGIDVVSVIVKWPGASADDVEENIIAATEPEVRFLDSVKKVVSFAREGVGTVVVEFDAGTDMESARADVDAALARVTTLPEDSEEPIVSRVVRYDGIGRILVSGAYEEASLKAVAKRIRDDLLARGVDKISLFGQRDEELWVEIRPETLRRLDLTMSDIAARIAATSLDMPAGNLEGTLEKQIRSIGQHKDARQISELEIRALPGGENIRLGDIATLSDNFDESGKIGFRRGDRAVELYVQRATSRDALKSSAIVDAYLAELRPTLPPALRVEYFDIQAGLIQERIDLLLRNGAGGLALVLITLFVFLNGRVAFWVAAGIPVAMLANLGVMLVSGQSINMISMFAMIMTLGIIVDDAIVVGEHADARRAAGLGPLAAAEAGALRMLAPVCAASLTTVAAFMPLLVVSDIIGQIISAIPYVVISVLVASLVECFLVLPGHLRGALARDPADIGRYRRWFDGHFATIRDGVFRRFVSLAVGWRYVTLATAVAVLVVCFGLIAGGRTGFVFFVSPEAEMINANILFAAGTPRERTQAMVAELDRALGDAAEAFDIPKSDLVVMSFAKVGVSQARQFQQLSGDRYGGLQVELAPSDHRDVRTTEFIDAWRENIRALPGVERISLLGRSAGPPGRDVDIRLQGNDIATLKQAALEVRDLLTRFQGVSDIEDDLPYGKQEIILELTPRGQALGFTTEAVARQVRDAFEGAIAKRFARGDEEVTIRVKYPAARQSEAELRRLYLRSPAGAEVAITEVVTMRGAVGFERIRRENGVKEVAVTAEIDEAALAPNELIEALKAGALARVADAHGLDYRFAGKAEEQAQTLADMRFGALIGLSAIYIILAWVFGSYTRPLVVMVVIPFGLVGAILGHMLLGYTLTILSLFALLGLSGILVNDSIVLVTTIDQRTNDGEALADAIVNGTCDRLRAVVLTSLTTILGLTPLLFETSLQAQFLIPMAITLVFGLMAATFLVLLVVPALIAVQDDFGRLFNPAKTAV